LRFEVALKNPAVDKTSGHWGTLKDFNAQKVFKAKPIDIMQAWKHFNINDAKRVLMNYYG